MDELLVSERKREHSRSANRKALVCTRVVEFPVFSPPERESSAGSHGFTCRATELLATPRPGPGERGWQQPARREKHVSLMLAKQTYLSRTFHHGWRCVSHQGFLYKYTVLVMGFCKRGSGLLFKHCSLYRKSDACITGLTISGLGVSVHVHVHS